MGGGGGGGGIWVGDEGAAIKANAMQCRAPHRVPAFAKNLTRTRHAYYIFTRYP